MAKFAFIFDQDGTLLHNKAFKYAIENVPRVLGLTIDSEEFYNIFLDTYYEYMQAGNFKEAFDWEVISSATLKKLGFDYVYGTFNNLMVEGIKKCMVQAKDGAVDVLRTIKEKEGVVYVLTNGYYQYQYPALKKAGLVDYIDKVITNDQLDEPKPLLGAFKKALSMISLSDDKIFYVGDHPFIDIYGAIVADINNIFWITLDYSSGRYHVEDICDFIAQYSWAKYRYRVQMREHLDKVIHVINRLDELLEFINEL